jgi:hypothetical protein
MAKSLRTPPVLIAALDPNMTRKRTCARTAALRAVGCGNNCLGQVLCATVQRMTTAPEPD